MRAVSTALPCYTGDVSGVCSALFELGGMVVVHDPSGCNSTYNTHDETRWYDHDSLIFISGLSERDAIFGNDEKLVREVVEAARALRPAFVALAGSPVPYLTGTDFAALARAIAERSGIETFWVPTNGMHDYVRGAGAAFAEVARRLVRPYRARRGHVLNVLGATPLDFAAEGCMGSLAGVLRDGGWEVNSCWAMGSELNSIARSGEASVNLVVSACGLAAARVLQDRFGAPYVVGLPVPGFREPVLQALERAAQTGESEVAYLDSLVMLSEGGAAAGAEASCGQYGDPSTPRLRRSAQDDDGVRCFRWPAQDDGCQSNDASADVALVGEPVCMGSLAAALACECGASARVVCPIEADRSLLGGAVRVRGEAQLRGALAGATYVVADPLYVPALPRSASLYPLPHLAFSGRCCLTSAIDLMTLDIRSVTSQGPRHPERSAEGAESKDLQ